MEFIVVMKSKKRDIIKITKNNLYSYAHVENAELVMHKANFQNPETVLIPTKQELKELFPLININTEIQINFDNYKCKNLKEKCTMINSL